MTPAPRAWVRAVATALLLLAGCAGATLNEQDAAGSQYQGSPTDEGVSSIVPLSDANGSTGGASGDAGPASGGAASDARPAGPDGPPGPVTEPPAPGDDADGDGATPPDDCDDNDPRRYPEAVETPGDDFDSNCDAQDDLPCVRATDCPPAWYCTQDFVCRPGCRGSDCRDGLQCHSIDRVCLPDDMNQSCGRDADCPQGTHCRFYTVNGTDALGTRCDPDEGALGGGAVCADDAECRSGVCRFDHRCLGLCRDAADCQGGAACAWTRLIQGETENRFHVCFGQIHACRSASECGAGEVCSLLARPDVPRGFVLACLPAPANAGQGGSGARCQSESDCLTGICLGDGTCFAPCADDAECADGRRCYDPGLFFIDDGGTELTADDVLTGFPFCARDSGSDSPCDALRHCPEGEVCAPRREADGRSFDTRCQTARGPGAGGEPCMEDADCGLGVCDEGRCAGLCFGDMDCAGGTTCASGRYVVDNRETPDPYDDLSADLGFCRP